MSIVSMPGLVVGIFLYIFLSVLVMLHIEVIMTSKMFSFMINGLTLVVRSANNIKAINGQNTTFLFIMRGSMAGFIMILWGSKFQASSRYLLLSMFVFIVFVSVCWCCHTNGLRG